ncbi:MAG: apolipoprotein N-acyltransferase [Gemmatimonadales bacterium]
MKSLFLPQKDWFLVLAGAVLVLLSYPPFHLFVPSFISLVPAVWLIEKGNRDPTPLRRNLVQGFWFGTATQGLELYWMVFALWRFTPLSVLGYAATVSILATYTALLFALTGWATRTAKISILLTFPVFWTTMRWFVGHQGDISFPWLGLGTSLTGYPTLVQIADVIGARGITFLLVLANVALAMAWHERRVNRSRTVRLVGSVLAGIGLAAAYGVVRQETIELRPVGKVAVVQPNVGYEEKADKSRHDRIVQDLIEMSARVVDRTRPDLVVWPEAAIPYYFDYHPNWEAAIAALVIGNGVPVVTGGVDVRWRSRSEYEYYNAAFLFDELGGRGTYPVYHKRYLVPIVERVPWVNPRWFKLEWFGGFGVGKIRPVYHEPLGKFGVIICYESAFEDLSRIYRRSGADFLINITNDAWFGKTTAPYQHKSHLVMRAIENRVGIVRSANSGISEFVDPLGREHHETGLAIRASTADTVLTSDVVTVYSKLGDWVGQLCALLTVALLVYARLQHRGERRLAA